MEVESIMLTEISQAVKDIYYMITSTSETLSTIQANQQNRARDLEIKNKLTVTRGVRGKGYKGKEGEGSSQGTFIKDLGTKAIGERGGLNVGGG